MKLYPSFREAVRRGRVDLRGEYLIHLLSGFSFARVQAALADVRPWVVASAPLKARWEGGGEDADGNPLPETLHAEPVGWGEGGVWANAALISRGGLLVAYEIFDREKPVRQTLHDGGLLTLG